MALHNFFLLAKCSSLEWSGLVTWSIRALPQLTFHPWKVRVILSQDRVCAEADAELLFQSQCKEAMAAAELCAGPNFPKYLIAWCRFPIDVCVAWSSLCVCAAQCTACTAPELPV